jgi:outer membrane receptor for ferrienterochelin and colicin
MNHMFARTTLLFSLIFFSLLGTAGAQEYKLNGKVLNEKNEALAGVSVNIKGGSGTTTDIAGRFSIKITSGRKYELEFSAIGYETKMVSDVEVLDGQVNELNILLNVKATTGENVTVSASRSNARKESAAALIAFQKNTNTIASVISAEAIRRSPDKNTGEVLKRIPGASIQEGRFLVVRGLADRYNQAMLNGILLTSTEPDRKTFSFDLIPAAMIDNIVINKAFIPEYPGEWAGGLIQVNTKDIPSKNFFSIQVGTSVIPQTTGKKFYKDAAGKLDWLGIDDGTRGFPKGYTSKYEFGMLDAAAKSAIGRDMRNEWVATETNVPVNINFQVNGGFNSKIFGKTLGGNFGIIYNRTSRYMELVNRRNVINDNVLMSIETDFRDDRYAQEIAAGAMGSLSLQLNSMNRISIKSLLNVNTSNFVTHRNGTDISRQDMYLQGQEFRFKQNTFFTTQLTGEHNLSNRLKFKWYGAFNILDGYIPDQRRLLYSRAGEQEPFRAVISNTLSQQSGSRIFQSLSDYIYTGGGDLNYTFNWMGQKQGLKGGYMLQVKDRLFDAILFANYLPVGNNAIRELPPSQIFDPSNFGDGSANSNLFAFNAIIDRTYRYMANTILNAGFLQMDNQFGNSLRVVWGLRVEHFDQLVGSVKKWDPRHTYSKVTDFLPGINATWKLNNKTNIRLSASQTVIRPELRELADLNLYDFELNASVQGNPNLQRTKVINSDLRYELYPRAGEVFTAGVFFKHFDKPIEQLLNEGGGGASTFTFQNPEKAFSYGAEVEFRKKLDMIRALKNFTFQANVAYIHSRVEDVLLDVDRSLQGQSPYVMNIGLLYDHQKTGFSSTLLFNQVGERIYLVGDKSAGAGTPDTYEAPRSVIDWQLAKKLFDDKAEIRLNISDLLNTTQYFYQNVGSDKRSFQKGQDAYRFTRRLGTTFSISFNYSL